MGIPSAPFEAVHRLIFSLFAYQQALENPENDPELLRTSQALEQSRQSRRDVGKKKGA